MSAIASISLTKECYISQIIVLVFLSLSFMDVWVAAVAMMHEWVGERLV